jgi:Tfp pilus assembly protein PilF
MSRNSKKKAVPEKAVVATTGAAVLNDRWTVWAVCIFLAAITFAVFWRTVHYEFVNYDDGDYVYENPVVCGGLTLNGIAQAFIHGSFDNWDPLTTISHMLDCQFYGLNPGGHHLTNVLLHTTTVIVLFLVLRGMTGFLWRSAFVAAVFAIHPLRVESVAWVSERKDVLSGLFFALTIGAYVRYARRPWASARYGLVVLLFALGLMCKPMLVTLPFVLLLLDFWPLKRFNQPGGRLVPWRLIVEKLPLFGLCVAVCMVTLFAQKREMQSLSLALRIGNALFSYVAYLGRMFYPVNLSVFYPYPDNGLPLWEIVLAAMLLAGISLGVFLWRRKHPCLLAGWLWYLIMLAPVIGLVQVGIQAQADRYTYLPQIGLYLLLTWMAADLCAGWRYCRAMLGGCSTIILVALFFCARAQTSYWQNSESLWTHVLACAPDNFVGHNSLGNALFKKGDVNGAIAHYEQALQIKPGYADAHNNLGNALLQKGSVDEAATQFQKALEIDPDNANAHNNLGNALLQKGNVDQAIVQFQKALQIKPDLAEACYNLGNALLKKGDVAEAIAHYQHALQIKPDLAEAHINLGNALLQKGNVAEAIIHYRKALELARAAGWQGIVAGLNAELKQMQSGTTIPPSGK